MIPSIRFKFSVAIGDKIYAVEENIPITNLLEARVSYEEIAVSLATQVRKEIIKSNTKRK